MKNKVYGIEIKETLSKVVFVKANSKEQAYEFVNNAYCNTGEITVNDDDYYDAEISYYDDGIIDNEFDYDATNVEAIRI